MAPDGTTVTTLAASGRAPNVQIIDKLERVPVAFKHPLDPLTPDEVCPLHVTVGLITIWLP